jgi:hypothetical protein
MLDSQSSPVKRLLLRKPKRGGQGSNWTVEPYDDDVMHENNDKYLCKHGFLDASFLCYGPFYLKKNEK